MNKMTIIVPIIVSIYQQIEEMLNGWGNKRERTDESIVTDILFSAEYYLTSDKRKIDVKKLTTFRKARELYKDIVGEYNSFYDDKIAELTEPYNIIHLNKDTILKEN